MSLSEQLHGLRAGHFDAGFARADKVGNGVVAQASWRDPLLLAIPARHPLLVHPQVPLKELARYPLVAFDPQACEGCRRAVERLLRAMDNEPNLVTPVTSLDMMLTLDRKSVVSGTSVSIRLDYGCRRNIKKKNT